MKQRRTIIKTILTPRQQIDDLKLKGVTFSTDYNEEQARHFLTYNTYYYKFKSYARNFEKYRDCDRAHKYINLDFSYLVALSNCDYLLRKFILQLTINIEHYFKVYLNNELIYNTSFNNDVFIDDFLQTKGYINNKLKHNRRSASPYIQSLTKSSNNYSYWQLFELLTFGDVLCFYNFYSSMYKVKDKRIYRHLYNIKHLRNSSAHNNCLLHSLTSNVEFNKLSKIGNITSRIDGIRNNATTVCFVHDICILLDFADDFITSTDIKLQYKKDIVSILPKIYDLKNMVSDTENLHIIVNDIICVLEHYSNT